MNPNSRKRYTAKFEQVLLDAGLPVLVLLSRKVGKGIGYFFAMPVTNDDGEIDFYFAVSVQRRYANEYFSGRCDLRYLFVYAPGANYYRVETDEVLKPKPEVVIFEGVVKDDYVPDAGFFVSDQTSQYRPFQAPEGEKRIYIDGQWKAREFTEIFNRYRDLCVLSEAISSISQNPDEGISRRYEAIIEDNSLRSGGNYANLFSELRTTVPISRRPVLKEIQWASPGKIGIRGEQSVFDVVDGAVDYFIENIVEINEKHSRLRDFLSKSGFLEISTDEYNATPDQISVIRKLTDGLNDSLAIFGQDQMRASLQNKPIVAAKVALTIFRRLRDIADFYMEGRASNTRD